MKPVLLLRLFKVLYGLPSFFILLFGPAVFAQTASLSLSHLTCDHHVAPIGLGNPGPAFSWQLHSPERNTVQTAWQIMLESPDSLTHEMRSVWNSGKVNSSASVLVHYAGPRLRSRKDYSWRVRVWDNHGHQTESSRAVFGMGILRSSDWKASWISTPEGLNENACKLYRKTFTVKGKILRARLYASARGLYEVYVNGKRWSDTYFSPGWTSYNKRLQYQVTDLTALLKPGLNCLGMVQAKGWFAGQIGYEGKKRIYAGEQGVLAELEIEYEDGSRQQVLSDGSWRVSTGAIRSSDIYDGETIDARLEQPGWSLAGFNDQAWKPVRLLSGDLFSNLVATDGEPVRKHEKFSPGRIFRTPKGELVVDFGQNLVGWVEIRAKGPAGHEIILNHAEVLDKAGNFYTENLRTARQQNKYILKGGAKVESFEPHFSVQGFRYVKVTGFPGTLLPADLTARALYSDMAVTGTFSCSDSLINKLQHNITWGLRGNFVDVPTDCPQRNERLGWTGDAQVFFRTAAFNRDVSAFFSKWLLDVAADQRADGAVPFVVPNIAGENAAGSAGWSDVSTIIPWNYYTAYGDSDVLGRQYTSMQRWVEFMHHQSSNGLWNKGFHFGDWLFYRPNDDNDGRSAVTDKYLIAQCFYARSTLLLIKAARVLGKTIDVTHYSSLLDSIKNAFVREYVTGSGRLVSSSQTAYVLALQFDMLPLELRGQAVQRLVDNIQDYHNHLTTGFLGTPYLCEVLSRFGRDSTAYRLLMQKTYPSWIYPITRGATTIWERWDGIKPDGSFQTPSMNSFNHYAYGAIGDWLYRHVAGLAEDSLPASAGYAALRLAPSPGGGLDSASASLETPYGHAASTWSIANGMITVRVEVPANSHARLILPRAAKANVLEGQQTARGRFEMKPGGIKGADFELDLGSGKYTFSYPFDKVKL